jgi:epoxyqueuosine reductase
MKQALVIDQDGQALSPCSREKALSLLGRGQALLVSEDPYTIRLNRSILIRYSPPRSRPTRYDGQLLLLHICCGPCATYTVQYLRDLGWAVSGFWFNPNIQPAVENARRLQALQSLAEQIILPMTWDTDNADTLFTSAIRGHERDDERCIICYRLRLHRTAQEAAARNIGTISTSLLISPFQDLDAIHKIGDEVAAIYNLRFYYENMRRGYSERAKLSRRYGLYLQNYCGCLYSAREAENIRSRKVLSAT